MPEPAGGLLLAFHVMASTKPSNGRSSSRSSSGRSSSRGGAAVETPPSGTGRSSARRGEVREALSGREHELSAIAFFVLGVLIGLAVYVRLAGPVGRGTDTALGCIIGMARYALPLISIAVGVALLRGDQAPSRMKLILGWGGMVLAALGLLHILRGPDAYTGVDALGGAGGWVGAAVGQTLSALIGAIGASLVFVALALGSLLLISNMGLTTMIEAVGRALSRMFGGVGASLRQVMTPSERDDHDSKHDVEHDENDVVDPFLIDDRSAGIDPDDMAPENMTPDDVEPEMSDPDVSDDEDEEPAPKPARRPRTTKVDEPHTQGRLDTPPSVPSEWVLPAANLLSRSGKQAIDDAEISARGRLLEESLRSHGVDVTLKGRTVGPTVTRYELELHPGVKVARVTSLQKDIAYAMAATDVRILAPIPGESLIGIEVPNRARQLVSLGDLMGSAEAKLATHPLDVAIGKDIAGRSVFLNLATTPHLLIAGATGAGKSSGINCIITSLLMRSTPDQVRMILIDPKQVEMGQYARLPHLLTQPVTNPKKAANALAWAVREMERRYDLLFEMGYRDITGYNAAFDRGEIQVEKGADTVAERMYFIVVVVDELNDLMMVAARDVEESITRIAQKARAVGIHLIVATQRPSVNVITGVIKANVPARAAYSVSSQTDSRVILDQVGAEKLVGKGDMLLLPGNSSVAQRIQGCWVEEEEVRKVVAHWRKQAPEVTYVKGVEGDEPAAGSPAGMSITDSYSDDDDDETLLKAAMELVVRSQLGSTSMLQRKLKVGFARAGRIMDLLEERGVVGPSVGSKAREVLMTVEEFEALG
ncbi:MAG: DNA translocase FtsK [Acidimicrobiia bacterium]|nr:DNA translocase FtsK [Actinomycetota bacterium]NDE57835.1 DNA translocase FtsK [Acidimicrobiia bacterium]NDE81015.1 DNA translocase FtsK [Actinomycetota bacterium]NDF30834.1 DNA translocase FtsK [Acidimicrobiia bacterium]